MKETLDVENPGDWDSPVSSHLMEEWGNTMSEAISQEDLQFIRGCRPANAVKQPRIVSFFDGSSLAFAAVLYIVWMVYKDGSRGKDTLPIGDSEDQDFLPPCT